MALRRGKPLAASVCDEAVGFVDEEDAFLAVAGAVEAARGGRRRGRCQGRRSAGHGGVELRGRGCGRRLPGILDAEEVDGRRPRRRGDGPGARRWRSLEERGLADAAGAHDEVL